jgi:hypothetical protein
MIASTRSITTTLASILLLAGCSDGKPDKPKPEDDPAATSALADEIMVDPELAGQQGRTGAGKIELPPEQRTPEAIAAAKAEALKLVGGTIAPAPEPASGGVGKLVERAATAARGAGAAGKTDCSAKVAYSASWANALPAALAIYPQGAVEEAAGTDADGCRLRVVSFLTPVGTDEVIDFYYTRLRAGGYDVSHHLDGNDHVLGGGKGKAAYLVYARALDNGLTEVDLVVGG